MKNLEKQAQAVWSASDTQTKKALLMEMVSSFQHKKKQELFYEQISLAMKPTKLDQLAANIMLCDTDAAIY